QDDGAASFRAEGVVDRDGDHVPRVDRHRLRGGQHRSHRNVSGLPVLAAFFVVYALAASRLERWSITAPMVFMTAGLLLGPSVLNILPFRIGDEASLTLTELTRATLLFADSSTVRLRDVEGDAHLPGRLLLLGLPLTIALGTLVAGLMFH